jgi:hypothetical protein
MGWRFIGSAVGDLDQGVRPAGFRRNFGGRFEHRGRTFQNKQLEVYAVAEPDHWLVITVITKLF